MQQSRVITRQSASNLALAFILLPKPRREAMSALYAFCREVDDVADEMTLPAAERRARLQAWREDVRRACGAGGAPEMPVNRELQPIIQQYRLPYAHFDALLQGVEMDLEISRYPDYTQLELYCYRVASVVGLLSIEIFGYTDPACRDYAVYLGKALQLTNILRDVRSDAERGRIYLPVSELERFGVTAEELLRCQYSDRFAALAESVAGRARHFYKLAGQTLPAADRSSMATAELMGSVYWRLLTKLTARHFDVFGPEPTRLSKPHKLALVARAWWRSVSGSTSHAYGA